MTVEEIIEQLKELTDDRDSFIWSGGESRETYVRDKEALEYAVKVMKRYNQLVQVKARPVKQHIKIQYEGEELTIRELIERLEDVQAWRKHWKELAMRQDGQIDELRRQLEDAQPVRHGRWIAEDEDYEDIYICSECGYEFVITAGDLESNELNYCPKCGAKMDDEDINVPTKSGTEEEDDG